MRVSRPLISALVVLSIPSLAAAGTITEVISVNTSALLNQAGAIDLEFNPGPVGTSQSATASVVQFSGPAIDTANPASTLGDVSGALPGTLIFTNGAQLNDAFTPVKFGSELSFTLTLSGAAVNNPDPTALNGSVFELGFYSSDGSSPLLTADGVIATLDLMPGSASAVPTTFISGATVSPVTPQTATPEPASYLAASGGLLFLFLVRKLSRWQH